MKAKVVFADTGVKKAYERLKYQIGKKLPY